MAKKKRPVPIAPKPIQMKSRKKARQTTSLFHKLTRQIDDAKKKTDTKDTKGTKGTKDKKNTQETIKSLEQQIEDMGGREEYQRASQLSTKFHSTSKWVLKVLGQVGWLHGRPEEEEKEGEIEGEGLEGKEEMNDVVVKDDEDDQAPNNNNSMSKKRKRQMVKKQPVNILEVGAINIELLNAATKTKRVPMKKSEAAAAAAKEEEEKEEEGVNEDETNETNETNIQRYKNIPVYNIKVRAIDLRSSHDLIEEQDFLTYPINKDEKYDVVVCSMVLNCVTTAHDRGKMLSLLYQQLSPGGLCFLTIPKLCLLQSKYIHRHLFEEMLTDGVGFIIEQKKDTPKVAFWVLKRPLLLHHHHHHSRNGSAGSTQSKKQWKEEWSKLRIIHRGKKYRNDFGVVLAKR